MLFFCISCPNLRKRFICWTMKGNPGRREPDDVAELPFLPYLFIWAVNEPEERKKESEGWVGPTFIPDAKSVL